MGHSGYAWMEACDCYRLAERRKGYVERYSGLSGFVTVALDFSRFTANVNFGRVNAIQHTEKRSPLNCNYSTVSRIYFIICCKPSKRNNFILHNKICYLPEEMKRIILKKKSFR